MTLVPPWWLVATQLKQLKDVSPISFRRLPGFDLVTLAFPEIQIKGG